MAKKIPAKKSDRPNREDIKDLPPHSQYQWRAGTWYVYFPYCFRENGARKQERDYIGTLTDDGLQFEPNLYFIKNAPVFKNRPPERCGRCQVFFPLIYNFYIHVF